jgi:hypothetical protein
MVSKPSKAALSLEKHRDKTFIGRIERGFDFLGYHFSPAGLSVAKKTIDNFIEKASRLYEQRRRAGSSASPLEMYVRRWLGWFRAGTMKRFQLRKKDRAKTTDDQQRQPSCGNRTSPLICRPVQGASGLEVSRFRRHQATRPPATISKPGNPAPTTGPGTDAGVKVGKLLAEAGGKGKEAVRALAVSISLERLSPKENREVLRIARISKESTWPAVIWNKLGLGNGRRSYIPMASGGKLLGTESTKI